MHSPGEPNIMFSSRINLRETKLFHLRKMCSFYVSNHWTVNKQPSYFVWYSLIWWNNTSCCIQWLKTQIKMKQDHWPEGFAPAESLFKTYASSGTFPGAFILSDIKSIVCQNMPEYDRTFLQKQNQIASSLFQFPYLCSISEPYCRWYYTSQSKCTQTIQLT